MRHFLLLPGACAVLASLGCADPVPLAAPLATGQRGVTSIAVDDFYVYMAIADGSIRKVSLDGGPVITVAKGPNGAGNLALDGDHVYWTTSGAIATAPKEGGDAFVLVAGESEIGGLTVEGEHVYFTAPAINQIRRASKVEGTAGEGTALTVVSDQIKPRPIAHLAGGVYWGNAVEPSAGAVMLLHTTANASAPLSVVREQSPTALAVTSTHLFWRNAGDGSVKWTDLGGGEVRTVATGQTFLGQIAGDEDNVYWTGTDGTLSMAPLVGGSPEVVSSSSEGGTVSLALDLTSVYWANSKSGNVMVRPKF